MTKRQEKIIESGEWYTGNSSSHIAVFPVGDDKRPLTQHGCKDAVRDPEKVRLLFESHPDFEGLAIATGPASFGLFVIDLDRHEDGTDGVETARDWQAENGPFPESWVACTPSGGQHLYFLGTGLEKCSVNKEAGVDCRAEGGYVVAPPSMDGKYFWDVSPMDVKLAEPNDSLLRFMDTYCKKSKNERFQVPEEIPEGCRNSVLFSAAASLQAAGWPDPCIDAAIDELNGLNCKPPLSSKEIGIILDSVKKYKKGRRFAGWTQGARFQEKEILEMLKKRVKSLT